MMPVMGFSEARTNHIFIGFWGSKVWDTPDIMFSWLSLSPFNLVVIKTCFRAYPVDWVLVKYIILLPWKGDNRAVKEFVCLPNEKEDTPVVRKPWGSLGFHIRNHGWWTACGHNTNHFQNFGESLQVPWPSKRVDTHSEQSWGTLQ
jgi:hypothetical protein